MLPETEKPKVQQIFAAQKIIADISSGLYRSPAAALKELVSNAYDADAEIVVIETDAPYFRTLVVRDDGTGMSVEHFLRVVTHIGGSRKRIVGGDETSLKGRKIVGRIGIGMLAVAQLGFKFYVTSSIAGEATRFVAEVDLEPFHKDDAALVSMGRMKDDDDEVLIGAVKYIDDVPEEQDAHYTIITIPETKKSIISEMTAAVRDAIGAKEVLSVDEKKIQNFRELADLTRSYKRADTTLDGYYYMLWELGHLCPVNYVDNGPFEETKIAIQCESPVDLPQIKDFKVFVDGIELRRPQLFPSKCALNYSNGPAPKLYNIHMDRVVAGHRLRLHGYIYVQQPRIDPEGLLGLHIRIRNVGIGKYDRTWLGYPFDEGVKFGQLSGEIFVEDGLEQALNIDRDSFKETDVHFQALRAFVWSKLREVIFPEFKLRQAQHRKERRFIEKDVYTSRFNERLSQLPAPLITERDEITLITAPTISNWFEIDNQTLRINRVKYNQLIEEAGLTASESKERLLRVIKVLLSSELLSRISDDDLDDFLRALAVAVQ